MTPKQIAIYRVVMLFASMIVAGTGLAILMTYFTGYQLGVGFTGLLLVIMAKVVYDIELDRAERLQKLNESVDNR